MSTSDSQNYLSNVFRQVYTYDGSKFVPSLNMSNISKITADSLTVTSLSLGGTNDNLYFGDRAGSTDLSSSDNVAIGVDAAAEIKNTSNSVFLGRSAGMGVDSANTMISIGMNTQGNGTSNIYIGKETGAAPASTSNIFIGHSINPASAMSNTLYIGHDGDVLLAGDFSNKWLGIGTQTPTVGHKLDVSGGANITGDLKVGGAIDAGSVAGGAITGPNMRLEDGTLGIPSYSFVDDVSLGMYRAGCNALGFGYQGIQTMCISGDRVGINTSSPSTTLEVNGDISANRYNGPDGTAAAPKYSFSSDPTTGIFLLQNGELAFTAGGVKQMTITQTGVITNTPSSNIGNLLSDSFSTRIANSSNLIGGVTLSNYDVSGVGTMTTSNILASGYIRDAIAPTQFDVSGGNISNSGTHTSANFMTPTASSNSIGGVSIFGSNVTASNFTTNTATSNRIGGVTINNSNVTASNFTTLNPTSNRIGGVTLNNSSITLTGAITGSTTTASNQIGGITLSNSKILAGNPIDTTQYATQEMGGGRDFDITGLTSDTPALAFQAGNIGGFRHFLRTRHDDASNASNAVEFYTNTATLSNGSTAPGTGNVLAMSVTSVGLGVGTSNISYNLDVSGTMRSTAGATANTFTTPTATSNSIGGVTLNNNALTLTGAITGSTVNTSNQIGGVTLNNTNLSLAGAITGSTVNTSNQIGGVTLNNTNLSLAGAITGSTVNTSNQIGGVTLNNTNLSLAGAITGTTANSSNNIGGVTLYNNNVSLAGTITGTDATLSNQIGGVTLINSNISLAGTITGTDATLSNQIGGVTLYNNNVSLAGTITGTDATLSNQIGGVTLYNKNITDVSLVTTTYIKAGRPLGSSLFAVQEFGMGAYADNTYGYPALAFGLNTVGQGGYRHFIRTRHDDGANSATSSCNSIDFFTNASANSNASTTPGTGNVLAMSVATTGVGIGMSNPTSRLHVSDASGSFTLGAPAGSYPKLEILGPTFANPNPGAEFINAELSFAAYGDTRYKNCIRSINLGGGAYADCNRMGFFTLPASGNLTLVERMSILPNGRVGIAVTNPGYMLDVSSGSSSQGIRITAPNGQLVLSNPGTSGTLQVFNAGTNVGLYSTLATAPITFSTNGTQKMTISGDRVGIGEFAPAQRLEVADGSIQVRTSSTGTVGTVLANGITFRATNEVAQDRGTVVKILPTFEATDNVFGLSFQTQAYTSVGIVEKMRITGGGNVGINTTSPIGNLHVRPIPATTDDNAILTLQSASTLYTRGYAQIRNVCIGPLGMGNALTFTTRTDSTGTDTDINALNVERMRIASTTGLGTHVIISNSNAGQAVSGSNWNESLYFTGQQRAWGMGVVSASPGSFGFFNYTASSGGPISGTRYIRGYILGADGTNNTAVNFTGQHRCFVKDKGYNDLLSMVGLVVVADNNQTINMSGGLKRGKDAITISESLPVVSLSAKSYDKRVFGVIALAEDPEKREDAFGSFVTPLEKQPGDTRAYINSVGEGAIWVVKTGENIESGDYVCSSAVPGYGQKQSDDLLHNYSIAKISMDCDFTAPLQPKYDILKDIDGNNVLDEKGNVTWIQATDPSGNTVFETAYDIRYVDASGCIVDSSANAFVAAFLPCTYHCG